MRQFALYFFSDMGTRFQSTLVNTGYSLSEGSIAQVWVRMYISSIKFCSAHYVIIGIGRTGFLFTEPSSQVYHHHFSADIKAHMM
jgi:hypothetical protein